LTQALTLLGVHVVQWSTTLQHVHANPTLLSALGYWIERADDVGSPAYAPSLADVLRLGRTRPRPAVEETTVTVDGVDFMFINLDESIAFRKPKLVETFFDASLITCCLYVADLAAFDQVDNASGANALEREFETFDAFVNSGRMAKTPVLLMLNKRDIFERRLAQGVSFVSAAGRFADYEGEADDVDAMIAYVTAKFVARNTSTCRDVYTHVSVAVEASMHVVYNACKDVILRASLVQAGFMME